MRHWPAEGGQEDIDKTIICSPLIWFSISITASETGTGRIALLIFPPWQESARLLHRPLWWHCSRVIIARCPVSLSASSITCCSYVFGGEMDVKLPCKGKALQEKTLFFCWLFCFHNLFCFRLAERKHLKYTFRFLLCFIYLFLSFFSSSV